MSISKVFHALIGDKSIVLQNTEFCQDYVIFQGRLKNRAKKCSCCGCSDVVVKETKNRTFRTLNLGEKRAYLKIDVHKTLCNRCGKQGWMQLPFTCGKLPLTNSFIHYVIQLTAMATLLAVAVFLGLQWKTVKNIDKANLAKRAKL